MKLVFNQYSKYYDLIYQQKNYVAEAKLILDVIKKYSPHRVKNILSIGCGTCSYETILAKEGYSITGLDQSQSMLDVAKKKITVSHLLNKIKLVHADAGDFQFNDKFDAVMELFNIFGYHTTNEDLNKVLKNINQSLKKNGLFLFDCWYLPAVLKDRPHDKIKEIKENKKHLIRITRSRIEINKNIIEITFHILHIEKNILIDQTEETHSIRYWSLPELKYILNSNGFKLVKAGNFLNLATGLSEDNWNMFIIAQKIQ